jgi:signal transduction histidine kinase
MLHEFLTTYRDAIISRTRLKLTARSSPVASASELEYGVPLFLTQLSDTLRFETVGADSATALSADAIAKTATRHGRDLRALGFNVSQVVHDYGDICQAITEVAVEQRSPISTGEFHILNRCLDTAIAEAVTEHARITSETRSIEEVERLGQLAHEIRDILNTALLSYHVLKQGTVAVNGSTGAVLGRSLTRLRDLVENTLSEVRISADHQRRDRLPVGAFLEDIAVAASMQAEYRKLEFIIEPVDARLAIMADPQLLASAVMNLLNNAFKFTHIGGRVMLRAHRDDKRVCIEVEDECGGIPESKVDPFQPFGARRGKDRTGLGLGLSIARKAVRAHGGDIRIRNMPGKGCIFAIEVPVAEDASVAKAIG